MRQHACPPAAPAAPGLSIGCLPHCCVALSAMAPKPSRRQHSRVPEGGGGVPGAGRRLIAASLQRRRACSAPLVPYATPRSQHTGAAGRHAPSAAAQSALSQHRQRGAALGRLRKAGGERTYPHPAMPYSQPIPRTTRAPQLTVFPEACASSPSPFVPCTPHTRCAASRAAQRASIDHPPAGCPRLGLAISAPFVTCDYCARMRFSLPRMLRATH